MKHWTKFFLKVVIFLVGIPVLAVCIFGLTIFSPYFPYWQGAELAKLQYPVLIGMYAAMIPFFFALYQAFRLSGYVDTNQIFSAFAVNVLKKIKYGAILISVLYVLELPFLYALTKVDDAPAIVIGHVVIFASMVVAFFTAVLQRLLQQVIVIQSNNDLTV